MIKKKLIRSYSFSRIILQSNHSDCNIIVGACVKNNNAIRYTRNFEQKVLIKKLELYLKSKYEREFDFFKQENSLLRNPMINVLG